MCLDIWLMNVVALTRLWSHLILHYLGLDHVGHVGGRNSMLMAPKLGEMDEVIKTIDLNSLPTNNNDQGRTLLFVVSDHGMTETGNHGRIIIWGNRLFGTFYWSYKFWKYITPNKANQENMWVCVWISCCLLHPQVRHGLEELNSAFFFRLLFCVSEQQMRKVPAQTTVVRVTCYWS